VILEMLALLVILETKEQQAILEMLVLLVILAMLEQQALLAIQVKALHLEVLGLLLYHIYHMT
jgi:hypothetical protein